MPTLRIRPRTCLLLVVAVSLCALPSRGAPLELPWREAGLSERQAAAHVLDRLAYGARPGEIDRVVELGLETWVERQLAGNLPDPEVDKRLRSFRSLNLSAREASETYPLPFLVVREVERAGIVDRKALEDLRARRREDSEGDGGGELARTRAAVFDYAREQGYRPMRELVGELMVQKLCRAVYSENQLTEVLVDFWFNHFNVSTTDNESRVYVASYERDAIRPYVLGSFRGMLEATAQHPAMLNYLDNGRSVAPEGAPKTFDPDEMRRRREGRRGGFGGRFGARWGWGRDEPGRGGFETDAEMQRLIESRRPQGLNENYARELLELHTLGVDGGYTQEDVVEVARAFTGWTTYPPGRLRAAVERRVARAQRLPASAGFVFEDSFLFRADAHDAGAKKILGRRFAAGRGIEDGLEVLDLLAAHPSTAHHLATKLARRFVADEPPPALVDRLAERYLASPGDLEPVLRALLESPEFWGPEARGTKIKSPFELAASALRAFGAEVREPRATLEWIARMGQPLYAYQAPTGYPDQATAWVNTGSLLHRMNFGLELATRRLAGVRFDLAALNGDREPESLVAALETYVPLLLPERDPAPTIRQLEPVVSDPELARKIAEAAPADRGEDPYGDDWLFRGGRERGDRRRGLLGGDRGGFGGLLNRDPPRVEPDHSPLAHVVGVILGSPEFQRR